MARGTLICLLGIGMALVAGAEARTWTASDGRTMEAEFVSADEEGVTVRRGGTEFVLKFDAISEADRKWVAEKLAELNKPKPLEGEYADRITGDWEKAEWKGMKYRLFGKDIDAGKEYPLLVMLHGKGSGGDDNEKQLKPWMKVFAGEENYSVRPCVIIAPQCPDDAIGWNGTHAEYVMELVEDIVDELPIDEDRIYVGGHSMGGYGTWNLIGSYPKVFAAAVPSAGGGNPGYAGEMKKTAIWAFHGAKDPTVPVTQTQMMVEACEKARVEVKYTEYPEEGHGIPKKVFVTNPELHEWLFAQKRK